MNRRSFLQSSAAVGSLAALPFSIRAADKAGKKYRTALIGAGWFGGNIVGEAMASGQCEIVGVCDVDQRQLDPMVEKITKLSGEAGPAYIFEKQGDDTTSYFTLRLAERFEHKLNARAKIWQMVEILPEVNDFNNYIVNAEIGVETTLTAKLSMRTYVQDTYDNQPAPDREKNDLKLVTALAYKF